MSYELFIGDRTFSSWSLRGWLMFEKFGLPFKTRLLGLYSGTLAADLADLAPARTVPAMRTPEGHDLTDSLSMAETLAERHPDAGLWPRDPVARALARNLVAEMHSGFGALRNDCPHNIAFAWQGFTPRAEVQADVARIEYLWSLAKTRHGNDGPWLFGDYSLADVFYAPVACRFATYALPIADSAKDYVSAHLNDLAFRRWRALAMTETHDPFPYALDLPKLAWPGPAPLPAKAVTSGTPENATCPYSGKPVAHLLEVNGRTFGTCNTTCRDKTINDAEAWPEFMALLSAR